MTEEMNKTLNYLENKKRTLERTLNESDVYSDIMSAEKELVEVNKIIKDYHNFSQWVSLKTVIETVSNNIRERDIKNGKNPEEDNDYLLAFLEVLRIMNDYEKF